MGQDQVLLGEDSMQIPLLRGSVFFLLSGALILMGLTKVLVPIFDVDGQLEQKMLCVGAINFYEIMLLVVLLFLVWRRVLDDAVALVLLLGIFIVASTVTLNVVAANLPQTVLFLGAAGGILFGVKLYLMLSRVLGPMSKITILALAMLMLCNLFLPGIMGHKQHHGGTNMQMHIFWFMGWHGILLGLTLLTYAMSVDVLNLRKRHPGIPILERHKFTWLFVALIAIATVGHQWAMQWAFFLKGNLADLLMVVPLVWWCVLRCTKYPTRKGDGEDAIAILAPGALIVVAILAHWHIEVVDTFWGWIARPHFILLVTGIAMTALTRRCPKNFITGIAMLYAIAVVLLWPNTNGRVELQIEHVFAAWAALCVVLAIVSRHYGWVMLALGSVCCAGMTLDVTRDFWNQNDIDNPIWLLLLSCSVLWAITMCIYRYKIPVWLGSIILLLGNIALIGLAFEQHSGLYAPWLAVLVGILWTTVMAVACGRWYLAFLGLAPFAMQCYQITDGSPGWQMIAGSFVLLIVGAAVSWWRSIGFDRVE